jgi:UrcA family protein
VTKLTPLIALTALACCSAAHAHDSVSVLRHSEAVNFRDLDVTTLQGAQALFQRMRDAASRVCSDPRLGSGPDSRHAYVQCVNNAMADAIATLDRPTVTALAAKHGIHPTTKGTLG